MASGPNDVIIAAQLTEECCEGNDPKLFAKINISSEQNSQWNLNGPILAHACLGVGNVMIPSMQSSFPNSAWNGAWIKAESMASCTVDMPHAKQTGMRSKLRITIQLSIHMFW